MVTEYLPIISDLNMFDEDHHSLNKMDYSGKNHNKTQTNIVIKKQRFTDCGRFGDLVVCRIWGRNLFFVDFSNANSIIHFEWVVQWWSGTFSDGICKKTVLR